MRGRVLTIVITSLITALVAGTAFLLWGRAQGRNQATGRLQGQIKTLQDEKAALMSRQDELETETEALKAQNKELQERLGSAGQTPEISRFPRQGWEQYFPAAETTTLGGESTGRVRELLGEPPFLLRSIAANQQFNREIWIYNTRAEDPTALYLFFKGDKLNNSRLDEFGGLYNSGLLDLEEFWTR